jgi:hypothetical protein
MSAAAPVPLLLALQFILVFSYGRVSRQVLKDSAVTRRILSTGCQYHDRTLKDLDMAFVVRCIGSLQTVLSACNRCDRFRSPLDGRHEIC